MQAIFKTPGQHGITCQLMIFHALSNRWKLEDHHNAVYLYEWDRGWQLVVKAPKTSEWQQDLTNIMVNWVNWQTPGPRDLLLKHLKEQFNASN